MARPRKELVRESLQELNALEERYRSSPLEARIRVVRLMKEEPTQTIPQIAEKAGCSERSAHRWWNQYRKAGLDGLLEERKREQAGGKAGLDRIADELAVKLRNEELGTLKEIQEWLASSHGVSYTIKGISNLLRDRLRVRRRWIFEEDEYSAQTGAHQPDAPAAEPAAPTHAAAPCVSEEVIRFLNDLPIKGDLVEWVLHFREALRKFLGDVDYIVMAVSANANIDAPLIPNPPYPMLTLTRNYMLPGGGKEDQVLTMHREDQRPSAQHLANGIRGGFPIEKYHPPVLLDYYLDHGHERLHLGSIILFRERTARPISKETLAVMESLRPFIIFVITDCIVRQRKGIPPDQYFTDVLIREAKLSVREREVLTLHIFGATYGEIAEQLFISVDTVRKHIKSIHAKTNTRTLSDLLARYFRSTKD